MIEFKLQTLNGIGASKLQTVENVANLYILCYDLESQYNEVLLYVEDSKIYRFSEIDENGGFNAVVNTLIEETKSYFKQLHVMPIT